MIFVKPGDNLQSVFDSAPENSFIHFAEGVYFGKASIRKRGLHLIGAGMEKTVFVYDDYAKKPDENGVELNTFRTWTIAVCADDVTMEKLAIVNSAGSPEKLGQEVALSVVADGFKMKSCRLSSTQDTLFCGPLPPDLIERYVNFVPDELRRGGYMTQHFEDCLIEGTVDFIFGCGDAVFEGCQIRSVRDARNIGYCAAPAHTPAQTRGFTFKGCRFTRQEGVGDGTIYLARPWRDYGLCVFEGCTYGPHISPLGFDKWNDTDRDRTARFYEHPPVPGRVPWVKA